MFGDFSVAADTYGDLDARLSEAMSAAWVRFAATGNPNGPGLPSWPAFRPGAEAFLELGDRIVPGTDLRKKELDFQEAYFAAFSRGSSK